jgi:ABC-type sugar transport system ATPase subunit
MSSVCGVMSASVWGAAVGLSPRLAKTLVYVPRDQIEAMTLDSRIAVMKDGVLQKLGTPDDIYSRPANTYVVVNTEAGLVTVRTVPHVVVKPAWFDVKS